MKNLPRGQKRRLPTSSPSADYEQLSFQPEFFAVKGKVFDDDEPIPVKPKLQSRPTRGKSQTKQPLSTNTQLVSTKNPFRFPSIKNEEIFESKLQESPSVLHSKKYKGPDSGDDTFFQYSTLKFSGDGDNDDDDSYVSNPRAKVPKRSPSVIGPTQYFNLEQMFGEKQIKFDTEIDDGEVQYAGNGGFKPSNKFKTYPKSQKSQKPQSSPSKLFKSTEDDFTDSEFFDFSIRPPRQQQSVGQSGSGGKIDKFKSDLGVKSLAIKAYKNKFDPQLQGGFKPSFKLRDFPNIHGSDRGSGVASPGQIKTYYDAEESDRDERIKHKLSSDPHPASKAQFQQFLKAKEDERLEKLAEEKFKYQQQKQIADDKEAELNHQHQVLQRQKEKLKQVEKHLGNKATRQSPRQKRRPNPQHQLSNPSRRQRNPNPINFSVAKNGQSTAPVRTITGKDGTYRVSFNIQ